MNNLGVGVREDLAKITCLVDRFGTTRTERLLHIDRHHLSDMCSAQYVDMYLAPYIRVILRSRNVRRLLGY